MELNRCTCQDTFFYSQTTNKCEACGTSRCKKCSSAEYCTVCEDNYVVDDYGKCVSTICASSFYFDFTKKSCQSCHTSCATCKSAGNCTTCPVGFKLGANICLQCRSNQVIVGDTCQDCGVGCTSCSNLDRCDQCVVNASVSSIGKCQC